MNNLISFDFLTGTASILGFLLALFYSVRKGLLTYRQKRQDSEREFEQEIARLRASGGSVSARTDLGFFVVLELSSLRDNVSAYRYHTTCLVAFSIMFLIFFLLSEQVSSYPWWMSKVPLLLCIFSIISGGINHYLGRRLEKFTASYERRIKEIWEQPVSKRADIP